MASGAKSICFISLATCKRVLGIQKKNLSDRKVKEIKSADGNLVYDLDEIFERCGELVFNHLRERFTTADGDSFDELKLIKLREEARKLKIDNDTQEGLLVRASDVEQQYTKGIKAVCDVLDSIPSMVKMETPSVSPSVLDTVAKCVAEARNKAVGYGSD